MSDMLDKSAEFFSPSLMDLESATAAALPGLEYLHDTGIGQTCDGPLPADHGYFPAATYSIRNFYVGSALNRPRHGEGVWSVEVCDATGERKMRAALQSVRGQYLGQYDVQLVRPVEGARLVPVEDPVLDEQVASVLEVFAGHYTEFAEQQAKIAPLAPARRRFGRLGSVLASLTNRAA